MNPSTEWAALVTATMNRNRTTYAEALRICSAEHPDWRILVSASGRSRATVQFFNSRQRQVITPEREDARKQFRQFVNEKQAKGISYGAAYDASAREHPEVYAATFSSHGVQFVNVVMPGEHSQTEPQAPTPIGSPQLKKLFWLEPHASQEEFEAGFRENGSVVQPSNPAKIFAGIVGLSKKNNPSQSNDAAIAMVKAKFPRLWEAVTALSNELV
jgi:hypothetical protein